MFVLFISVLFVAGCDDIINGTGNDDKTRIVSKDLLQIAEKDGFDACQVKIGVFWEENVFSPDCGVYAYITESVPLTDKEIEEEKEVDYRRKAFKAIFHRAIAKGYKRIGTTAEQDKVLQGKGPYWCYKEKDYETLAKYYAHAFTKE